MDGNGTNVVRVSFEGGDLLGGVIVIDAELEVVRAADNPVLARDESTGTDRNIGKLKCFDDGLINRVSVCALAGTAIQCWNLPVSHTTRCKHGRCRV